MLRRQGLFPGACAMKPRGCVRCPITHGAISWARRRRGYCACQVPLTPIVVHVVRPGARSDALLAALAGHLGREVQPPDERGHVRILLEEPLAPAWQHVHDGLDAVGDDWQEHLELPPLAD